MIYSTSIDGSITSSRSTETRLGRPGWVTSIYKLQQPYVLDNLAFNSSFFLLKRKIWENKLWGPFLALCICQKWQKIDEDMLVALMQLPASFPIRSYVRKTSWSRSHSFLFHHMFFVPNWIECQSTKGSI